MPAFIVAEAGCNHLGDRAKMLAFCDAAKACGADAVKFQAYDTTALIKRRGITDAKTINLLMESELLDADLDAIAAHCKAIGFKWFASVFDPSQIERVLSRGACALKIGHAEEYWSELVEACQDREDYDCPLWISHAAGQGERRGNVLCRAEYPATSRPVLDSVGGEMGYSGFSSHYTDYRIPAAAALCGAGYIEAHLKLSDADPEAAWSLSVEDFTKMVKLAKEFESWL